MIVNACMYITISHAQKLFTDNSKPSIKQLVPFVENFAPKWYKVGALLLKEEQEVRLGVIQANHGSNVEDCCLAMLRFWIETHPEANWHDLVMALRSPGVDLLSVASDIENKLIDKNISIMLVTYSCFVCLANY